MYRKFKTVLYHGTVSEIKQVADKLITGIKEISWG